jgi:CheY-like chemotaxis protein
MIDFKEIRKQLKGLKLLYVEDDEIIRLQFAKLLSKLNVDVDTAFDGLDGLEKARLKRYDLLLTDIFMPRMNGIELIENIVNIQPDIVVIVNSAFNDANHLHQCEALGVKAYLGKPVDQNTLLNSVIDAMKFLNTSQ